LGKTGQKGLIPGRIGVLSDDQWPAFDVHVLLTTIDLVRSLPPPGPFPLPAARRGREGGRARGQLSKSGQTCHDWPGDGQTWVICSPNTGQSLVNHWSNTGKHWSNARQSLFKRGSKRSRIECGRTDFNHWSNTGQSLVKHGSTAAKEGSWYQKVVKVAKTVVKRRQKGSQSSQNGNQK
jgi:hypothetical protein